MTKKILTFGIFIIVLAGIFVLPLNPVSAQQNAVVAGAAATNPLVALFTAFSGENGLVSSIFKAVGSFLMVLSGIILTFSGMLFDWVVDLTVIKMGQNLASNQPLGESITAAWATLRDIANMCFIFVLLYAAFGTMFDSNFSNFQTTVKNIIIVALLINFSLFFTKVVIDSSNIVSIGFYRSIVSTNQTTSNETPGISTGYMQLLNLQSWHDPNILNFSNGTTPDKILLVGILSSVFMLITAVILLISGVMFVARYIILIFLMILSPLALIAIVIPGMRSRFDEWRKAVVDQSFFAPLFFALTWVVFKIANNPGFLGQMGSNLAGETYVKSVLESPSASFAIILNYVLVMGFAIAALIFAKQMATKTAGFKMVAGGIGAGVMGGAALAGRQTLGRYANRTLNDKDLRDRAAAGDIGARMKLATAENLAKRSFDVRGLAGTKVGKYVGAEKAMGIAGKAGGAGGFHKAVEEKAKRKAQYAKDVYGQTEEEKENAKELENNYNESSKRADVAAESTKDAKEKERKGVVDAEKNAKTEKERVQKELEERKKERDSAVLPEMRAELDKKISAVEEKLKVAETTHGEALEKKRMVIENNNYSDAVKNLEQQEKDLKKIAEDNKKTWEKMKNAGKERQEAYAKRVEESRLKQTTVAGGLGMVAGGVLGGPLGALAGGAIGGVVGRAMGTLQGNKAASRAIRKQAGEKSKAEKAADAAAEWQKEKDEQEKTEKGETKEKKEEKSEEEKEEKS